jgi:hypothetical protein
MFRKKIISPPVKKSIISIVFIDGKHADFERIVSPEEFNDDKIILSEDQKNLQEWWLNPYFPNGIIRKTTSFDYGKGRLLLDRDKIRNIRIFKIEE